MSGNMVLQKESPEMKWFSGLYCAFDGIVLMIVWWYALEIDLMFFQGIFKVFGAFMV